MARLLIRRISGGETLEIDDSAWPFFSHEYVIVDTLDDANDDPLYLTTPQSDFRYVRTEDISDPASPDGSELRVFFEEKVPRDGATAGQVPVLQSDGKMAFGAGSGGGGGGGTITSVNGLTGPAVVLDADDIGDGTGRVTMTTAERALLASLGTVPSIVRHTGGTDPVRPNTTRPVVWVVPDANRPPTNGTTSGGAYAAVNGLDYMWTF